MPALACVETTPGHGGLAWDSSASLPVPDAFPSGAAPLFTQDTTGNGIPWSVDCSAELYKIQGWGAPYFSINESGNVSVRPHGCDTRTCQEIDLMKIVKKVSDPKYADGLGLPLPVILRFPDVLRNRLKSLQSAFDYSIQSNGYSKHYQGVYPVKCNQDRYVVEDIVDFGRKRNFGLEAGSKPELLLAMSCLVKGGGSGALLVCNGYKDEEYISLALMASKMDLNVVIVLEQEEELDTVVAASRRLVIRPVIGLRAKLRTKHAGHFGSTSGEKGKFGLTTLQILSVVRKLRNFGMLDCLQLLHFHIGSQIPSTQLLSEGVREATQIYCELARLGANMKIIDVGGGLGIDYDGTHSDGSDMSIGYSFDEYASAVVETVAYACNLKNVPHPILCSESGRALVSHHSVLVFEAVSSVNSNSTSDALDLAAFLSKKLPEEARLAYCNLMTAAMHGDEDACVMTVDQLKSQCMDQFNDGILGLEHLAAVDSLCEIVLNAMQVSKPVKTYHANLSIFTSVPDFWAIGQLFPVMPIHHLDQRPTVDGILSDLTCDSDGKMDRFIGGSRTLPLHGDTGGGGYYLGMFLGGAYQEALGGLHNLFGGPSVVRVSQSDGPHCFAVTRAMPGPSCQDVLRAMHHEPEEMFQTLKHRAEEYDLIGKEDIMCDLAHVFTSMPYLVSPAASYSTEMNFEDEDDEVQHYNSDVEEDL